MSVFWMHWTVPTHTHRNIRTDPYTHHINHSVYTHPEPSDPVESLQRSVSPPSDPPSVPSPAPAPSALSMTSQSTGEKQEGLQQVRLHHVRRSPLFRWSESLEVKMSIHGPASAFFPFRDAARAWSQKTRGRCESLMNDGNICSLSTVSEVHTALKHRTTGYFANVWTWGRSVSEKAEFLQHQFVKEVTPDTSISLWTTAAVWPFCEERNDSFNHTKVSIFSRFLN